ncbi:IS110 family transposase [Caballeronia sp. LZ035]|uniref:IS110 family transposase n=1 Tax=Caballeronia sp. LZ035 TaxID=3038568 RepID=UPI00285B7B12|nr:IS110 family transposase [Caballeronia sp. LZ035]MDR5763083.1 IS110 family transposase [Caballeronia sp. LZ035]
MIVKTVGLDIAKNVFQVHGVTAEGRTAVARQLKRNQVLAFFYKLPPCLVAIEACASSHYWARELQKLGHEVKLIPAQYVKPFVRRSKTDANDAAAICDAVLRPDMPTVAINTPEQQAIQMVHRIRQRLMTTRTALINQMRGLLGEYGIVFPARVAAFKDGMRNCIAAGIGSLPALARELTEAMWQELGHVEARIAEVDNKIKRIAAEDERCARLLEVPGVGPVIATALVAAVDNARRFRNSRCMAASFGLTPHEHSSGGKQKLLGISKRGDGYLRWLLIQGARSILRFASRREDAISRWANALAIRRGANIAAVALTNKLSRIAWSILAKNESFHWR